VEKASCSAFALQPRRAISVTCDAWLKRHSRTLTHDAVISPVADEPGWRRATLHVVRWFTGLPSRFWRWLMDDTPPPKPDTYRVGDEEEHAPWQPGDDFRVDGAGGVPPL
jgi:hypothetical protein